MVKIKKFKNIKENKEAIEEKIRKCKLLFLDIFDADLYIIKFGLNSTYTEDDFLIHFNILKNITKNNYKFFDNFFIFLNESSYDYEISAIDKIHHVDIRFNDIDKFINNLERLNDIKKFNI